MSQVSFLKYHGAGNDFILIDLRHFSFSSEFSQLAKRMCARRWGIGADGLLIIQPSTGPADCRMRIFNADGSEPSMCGNGIRCVADFLFKEERLTELKIETLHGILKCRQEGNEIAVNLGTPQEIHWPLALEKQHAYVVDTGVPHAVIVVESLDIDVELYGRKIRHDIRFAPHGVNVNFATISNEGHVVLRTYERGVEAETLACGTGAAAAAYVALKEWKLAPPISIQTRGAFTSENCRSSLKFLFPKNTSNQIEIEMLGKAEMVFKGSFFIE